LHPTPVLLLILIFGFVFCWLNFTRTQRHVADARVANLVGRDTVVVVVVVVVIVVDHDATDIGNCDAIVVDIDDFNIDIGDDNECAVVSGDDANVDFER
jgi:hypothetical protein